MTDLAPEAISIQDIEGELLRRLLYVPRAPKDFDPLKAKPEQLAVYGIPPRPPETEPEAFEIWKALVTTPLQPLETIVPDLPLAAPTYHLGSNTVVRGGRQQTSRNWSGVLAAADPRRPAMTIYGKWKVPEVRLPAGATEGQRYVCSIWAGLDGHRKIRGSLPQVGTTQEIVLSSGRPVITVHAWAQWWMRDHANPVLPFGGFVVRPGDDVVCALQVVNPQHVIFTVGNLTTGLHTPPKPILAPEYVIPLPPLPPVRIPIPVRGVMAEWVVERPTIWEDTALYPLPDFDPIDFERCLVVGSNFDIRGPRSPRFVRMIDTHRPTARSVVLASSRKTAEFAIRVSRRDTAPPAPYRA